MNTKMTTNSQLSTTEPKKQTNKKTKLSTQLEQEQNDRNGDHMEGHPQGAGGGGMGKRYREKEAQMVITKQTGKLRIVWEMEKPKNLHVTPMDMN